MTNANPHQINILRNSGSGNFSSSGTYAVSPTPRQILVTDIENDGDLDLVSISRFANSIPNKLAVLRNDGSGGFGTAQLYAGGGFSDPDHAAVGDLNLDGFVDLAIANSNNGTVEILFNQGTGNLGPPIEYEVDGGTSSGPGSIAIVNVFGNSAPELAIIASQPFILIMKNNGEGSFLEYDDYFSGTGLKQVASGDLDGDDDVDFVVANEGSEDVAVFLNLGNREVSKVANYFGDFENTSVCLADMDADDDLDIVVGGNRVVSVLFNNGKASFVSGQQYLIDSTSEGVAAGDLNGDSLPDAVSTNGFNEIAVLINAGSGSLEQPTYYPAGGNGPSSVALEDLDLDGDLDVVLTNQHTNVSVLRNNGNGVFAPAETMIAGLRPIEADLGDINGDEFPDLVVANEDSHDVSVFVNDGTGSFGPQNRFSVGGMFPKDVKICDMNEDGINDLVVANTGSNDIAILPGLGGGEFGQRRWFYNTNSPLSLAVVDFDSDQRLDILTGNLRNNNISLMWQNCAEPNETLLGDVNLDGVVDLLDIAPFVAHVINGIYQPEADINQDGAVDLLDIAPFVAILTS